MNMKIEHIKIRKTQLKQQGAVSAKCQSQKRGNLTSIKRDIHHKNLGKEEQNKADANRRKKLIKIRTESNETKYRKANRENQ